MKFRLLEFVGGFQFLCVISGVPLELRGTFLQCSSDRTRKRSLISVNRILGSPWGTSALG